MNSQLLNSVPEEGDFFEGDFFEGDFFINKQQEPGTTYSCLMVFTQYGICTVRRLYVLPRAEPEQVHAARGRYYPYYPITVNS